MIDEDTTQEDITEAANTVHAQSFRSNGRTVLEHPVLTPVLDSW